MAKHSLFLSLATSAVQPAPRAAFLARCHSVPTRCHEADGLCPATGVPRLAKACCPPRAQRAGEGQESVHLKVVRRWDDQSHGRP